jgi:hypothetical protein
MNTALIFQIVQVAISLAQSQLDSKDVASSLLAIVRQGTQAYEANTGLPLDPNLIKAEDPV